MLSHVGVHEEKQETGVEELRQEDTIDNGCQLLRRSFLSDPLDQVPDSMLQHKVDAYNHETYGLTEDEGDEDVVVKDFADGFCEELSGSCTVFVFIGVFEYLIDIFLIFLQVIAEALHDAREMCCTSLFKIQFIYIELFNSFFLPNCWFVEEVVLFIIFTLHFRVLLSSFLTQNGEGVNHPSSDAEDAYYNQVYNESFHISQTFCVVPVLPDDICWL